jgi:hypothetical protein
MGGVVATPNQKLKVEVDAATADSYLVEVIYAVPEGGPVG